MLTLTGKYWKPLTVMTMVIVVAVLCILLANNRAELSVVQSDKRVLESDNKLQGLVIATQAFNFNRFNQIAEFTNRNNSLIDAGTENTVIEYREILRREKTCDLPVPADVAGGLLDYANRIRSSAMHTNSVGPDEADDRTVATSTLTYCQAVLWIKPLLAVIEKGNNNFAGIREIEETRASQ
ncbi:TPA: hypothetical protein MYQ41_004882 [Citrobacter amalonaticus]|nr:hypothetical protein [Citrobacter amalonaticus]HCB1891570.1 hypothetical protein [Citrobacter amalonaticus]HCB1913598.1 hypothetical protein [Citrobacter amalonaticus]